MTMRHGSHPTMPQVLEQHYRRLLHETSISEYVFATDVRQHHEHLVPPSSRSIEWSQHPDPTTRMRRDAEKLSRWFRDDVHARFPVEALEAFIAAFPAERRFALQQEMARRQDLLAVPMPHDMAGADAANLGRVAKEAGEAIVAISEILKDGRIDARDTNLASVALNEIEQALAVLVEMRERIEHQVMGRRADDLVFAKPQAD